MARVEYLESGYWKCEACGTIVPPRETHICTVGKMGGVYISPPQPVYDQLRVGLIDGARVRQAFKNGVEVDERTGQPLRPAQVEIPPEAARRKRSSRRRGLHATTKE